MVNRVVRAVEVATKDAATRNRLKLERKASWIAGGVVAASLALGALGGYWRGWSDGYSTLGGIERDVTLAFRSGPEAADAWRRLMMVNDPRQALTRCSGSSTWSSDRRTACLVPLWLDGPGAPHVGAR